MEKRIEGRLAQDLDKAWKSNLWKPALQVLQSA